VPPPCSGDDNTCIIILFRYFRKSDTYNFLLIVNNDVSSHIEVRWPYPSPPLPAQVVPVTVYEGANEAQYGMVVIPVSSSIIVVILLISGIALHAHYRNRLAVEVGGHIGL
jgi:hypothetical protein